MPHTLCALKRSMMRMLALAVAVLGCILPRVASWMVQKGLCLDVLSLLVQQTDTMLQFWCYMGVVGT